MSADMTRVNGFQTNERLGGGATGASVHVEYDPGEVNFPCRPFAGRESKFLATEPRWPKRCG